MEHRELTAFIQQRRKALEREPRDWDTLKAAVIAAGGAGEWTGEAHVQYPHG
jgi:hypothetical protein